MRVNIYAEEMSERVEIVEKNGFTGLRLYLYLPVTYPGCMSPGDAYAAGYGDGSGKLTSQEQAHRNGIQQISGPFLHHEGDDDSSAVTFWGKRDLRQVLRLMLERLNIHYGNDGRDKGADRGMLEDQANAWMACAHQLEQHNPNMWGWTNGRTSAVDEIKRLQACERDLKRMLLGGKIEETNIT